MITRHSGSRHRRSRIAWLAVSLAVVALAVPSTVFASGSDPSAAQYQPTSSQISAGGGGGGGGGGEANAAGGGGRIAGLPFTGLDLGVLAIAAFSLLGAGVALRRLSDPARRSAS